VSNADPRVTLTLLGQHADEAWKRKVESVPIQGCTLKLNVWLRELPDFKARQGLNEPHHYGQVNTPLNKAEWRDGYAAARAGRLPDRLWTELYFQSVHDSTVAPPGTHTMSIFSQYVPYAFADGKSWDEHRDAAKSLALDALARYCTNIPDAVLDAEALGPPDIEKKVGLTGGHIFQGECLPQYMWSNRLSAKTPMPGVYLCGAGTHPGGSVIAINGRNAAMAVLEDFGC
jgi:phytoene dehydrogenase-like protein